MLDIDKAKLLLMVAALDPDFLPQPPSDSLLEQAHELDLVIEIMNWMSGTRIRDPKFPSQYSHLNAPITLQYLVKQQSNINSTAKATRSRGLFMGFVQMRQI